MDKINIETLIKNFVLDENIIKNIKSGLNKSILNYYSKKSKIDSLSDIIENIIKNSFGKELENKQLNEVKEILENYKSEDYINTLVDITNESLISSYMHFETDVDEGNIEKDENITIIKKSQFDGYTKLVQDIKNEFLIYIS